MQQIESATCYIFIFSIFNLLDKGDADGHFKDHALA